MPTDFTVIIGTRQRFGDQQGDIGEVSVEQEAPFVGQSKDYPFSCPNVSGERAVITFQSLGVTGLRDFGLGHVNILRVNGTDVLPGITRGPATSNGIPLWTTHQLLIDANVLREQNVLHIESVPIPRGPGSELDNFIVDNVVVFFKTRGSVVDGGTLGQS
jgi:hypothetical protein